MAKAHFMHDPHRADPSIAAHGSKLDQILDSLQALHDKLDAGAKPLDPPADPPADDPPLASVTTPKQTKAEAKTAKADAAKPSTGDTSAETRNADSVTEKVFEDETHDREPFKRDVYSKN